MPRRCMAQEVRRGAYTVTWERDAGLGERYGSMLCYALVVGHIYLLRIF